MLAFSKAKKGYSGLSHLAAEQKKNQALGNFTHNKHIEDNKY
jgi:hypothetical protein